MDSIRNAAKNTSFQNWLEATVSRPIAGGLQPPVSGRPEAPAQGTPGPSVGSLQEMALADVASYLVPSTLPAPSPGIVQSWALSTWHFANGFKILLSMG